MLMLCFVALELLFKQSSQWCIYLSEVLKLFVILRMFAPVQGNIVTQIRSLDPQVGKLFLSWRMHELPCVCCAVTGAHVEWVFWRQQLVPQGREAGIQHTRNLKTVTYPVRVLSSYPPPLNTTYLGFFTLLLLRYLIQAVHKWAGTRVIL